VDYIALGHIHKPAQFVHPVTKKLFAAYPGTPEGLTAKEEGERSVIFGELKSTGELRLKNIAVQTRQIRKLEIGLERVETNEELAERVSSRLKKEDPNDLLYVTFAGERVNHFTPSLELLQS
ncbi:hypothetical protein MXD63_36980, partial [Frankia sp. Cpl3]|nr:hypothetical protein [Frankia sp. Cpl3]